MDMTEAAEPRKPAPDDESRATVATDGSGHTVVWLHGEIDLGNTDKLEQVIMARLQPSDTVVFDLSAVDFMDTSGIALLLGIVNTVSAAEIRAPSKQVRRVLEVSGLTDILRVTP
jgi:anti-anti-sigma factor